MNNSSWFAMEFMERFFNLLQVYCRFCNNSKNCWGKGGKEEFL